MKTGPRAVNCCILINIEPKHPEPFKSPYPRNSEIEALQLPSVASRLAADLISIFLGITVTLVRDTEPDALFLSAFPLATGVAFAVFVQRRGFGRAWQSIGFGFFGAIIGFTLPASRPLKASLNLSIDHMVWGLAVLFLTPVLAALCWKILDQRNKLDPERCDGYQAFRRAVGFHLYSVPVVLALLAWMDDRYDGALVSAVIASLLLWRLMRARYPATWPPPERFTRIYGPPCCHC